MGRNKLITTGAPKNIRRRARALILFIAECKVWFVDLKVTYEILTFGSFNEIVCVITYMFELFPSLGITLLYCRYLCYRPLTTKTAVKMAEREIVFYMRVYWISVFDSFRPPSGIKFFCLQIHCEKPGVKRHLKIWKIKKVSRCCENTPTILKMATFTSMSFNTLPHWGYKMLKNTTKTIEILIKYPFSAISCAYRQKCFYLARFTNSLGPV